MGSTGTYQPKQIALMQRVLAQASNELAIPLDSSLYDDLAREVLVRFDVQASETYLLAVVVCNWKPDEGSPASRP
jgi:hypothetical protein